MRSTFEPNRSFKWPAVSRIDLTPTLATNLFFCCRLRRCGRSLSPPRRRPRSPECVEFFLIHYIFASSDHFPSFSSCLTKTHLLARLRWWSSCTLWRLIACKDAFGNIRLILTHYQQNFWFLWQSKRMLHTSRYSFPYLRWRQQLLRRYSDTPQ